jgi:Tfp pilus assembly major pilin PilA
MAIMEVSMKGILLLLVEKAEIFAAMNKPKPIINGIKVAAATTAANGLGLKSKCCPLENGSVNIKTMPTPTNKNTANATISDSFEKIEEYMKLSF